MEIVKKQDLGKLDLKNHMTDLVNMITKKIRNIGIGDAVVISHREWTIKTRPSASYINNQFKRNNEKYRCEFRNGQSGKMLVFIRIK